VIWVGWRQQRTETLIAFGILAVLAAVAIPVGVHMASVYAHEGLSGCIARRGPGDACNETVAAFQTRFTGFNMLFQWSSLLPPLCALLLAAPFLLDLDGGTYRLFWTQSITRRRWLVTKLGLSVIGTIAAAALLTVLATWSRAPLDHLNGRMGTSTYDIEGVVPTAYALFVLGLAVAIGALWRRTVPALLTAFVGYVVLRSFTDSWLRQRLLAPVTRTWRLDAFKPGPVLDRALVINQYPSDAHGRAVGGLGRICSSSGHVTRCAPMDLSDWMTAVYQPAGRFWALQGIELGLVGGTGVVLLLLGAWWTHRRSA
jgi:phosphotransferase system  glucose/maltose/N-acetylglucosamine-specific IIC component